MTTYYRVCFQRSLTGPVLRYEDGYATQAEADNAAAWLTANGYWYENGVQQRPPLNVKTEAYAA